ncbi:hypothetical protein ANCCAN_07629 [Ancylostoma caninum]|uniref:Sulfur globule protein CV3 domain protein n=1 Tax=Ancylostoma caninum TaxID=29170 RepID=A0A368GTL7_ANCCA|nr:hypothetical protein ANCCAN_07629 [Ancylostoma caninum]
MKLFGALLVLIACFACLASSTAVRVKRQCGYYGCNPFNPNFGYGGYYGYGPRPYWRRPTVIKKTVIYRGG